MRKNFSTCYAGCAINGKMCFAALTVGSQYYRTSFLFRVFILLILRWACFDFNQRFWAKQTSSNFFCELKEEKIDISQRLPLIIGITAYGMTRIHFEISQRKKLAYIRILYFIFLVFATYWWFSVTASNVNNILFIYVLSGKKFFITVFSSYFL